MDENFGYYGDNNGNEPAPKQEDNKQENITDLGDGKSIENIDNDKKETVIDPNQDAKQNPEENKEDKKETENNLSEGTKIELEDKVYTVDKNGNLLDTEGNIFKEAKDVNDWLNSFDKEDEDSEISIASIQKAIGTEITDEDGNAIAYENTPEGINSYVQAVIEASRQEHYETALNTLYQKYPIIGDVLNYYIANGNSLEGFNEIPDRSNIVIDAENEAQQESIIRTAWKEQNRKGSIDSYISYLKTSGGLYAAAKEELAGLQEADKLYRQQLEEEAERKENERIQKANDYWNNIRDVIKSRTIAGYRIPENIIITKNGQKMTVTPEDFFNYIYQVDKDGRSAYDKDLAAKDENSRRDDLILRAYLTYVGGNYSNLVDMAINNEKVKNIKLKAKDRNKPTIRVKTNPDKKENIDFGY